MFSQRTNYNRTETISSLKIVLFVKKWARIIEHIQTDPSTIDQKKIMIDGSR